MNLRANPAHAAAGRVQAMRLGIRTLLVTAAMLLAAAGALGGRAAAPESRTPLYDRSCAECHGAAAKYGPRTAVKIERAIRNVPQMSGLATLSAVDIQKISDELYAAAHVSK